VIIADTGAIIALVDRDDRHHQTMRALFNETGDDWRLPWAILPEVDYLLAAHVGDRAQAAFLADVAEGAYTVLWGGDEDLERAQGLIRRYRSLRMGLVDAVVMAAAVRTRAAAIATLDVRHFGAVKLPGSPRLLPRDS
jgi:predicted nucleic acid-binding protein